MSVGLLSLSDELLVQISTLVLISSQERWMRISPPRTRFTYENCQWQASPSRPTKLSLQRTGIPSQSPRRAPRKRYVPSANHYFPSSFTRSLALAALPQRPYNPYLTRTSVSYLFVCRYLRNLATPIFYGNYSWHIGLHDRAPTICTFRSFLDAIGSVARSCIRSILVLTRFGYNCLWECLPSGWIVQLRRCKGLRVVYVSTSQRWVRLLSRRDNWSEKLAEIWCSKGLE